MLDELNGYIYQYLRFVKKEVEYIRRVEKNNDCREMMYGNMISFNKYMKKRD